MEGLHKATAKAPNAIDIINIGRNGKTDNDRKTSRHHIWWQLIRHLPSPRSAPTGRPTNHYIIICHYTMSIDRPLKLRTKNLVFVTSPD